MSYNIFNIFGDMAPYGFLLINILSLFGNNQLHRPKRKMRQNYKLYLIYFITMFQIIS